MNKETILSCLDITSLGAADNEESVARWAADVLEKFESAGAQPAALCVYPNFVDTVGLVIGDSPVRIASVAGGFPAGQTYLEVKMLEAAMAVENGADEIDMVLNLGAFLSGHDEVAASEIATLRTEIGTDVTLKVIIESGLLQELGAKNAEPVQTGAAMNPVDADPLALVRRAAQLAIDAGADFVKTSTGKTGTGATPEAVRAICEVLAAHAAATGRQVGIKVAGGVRTLADATVYAAIVAEVLGNNWLKPSLFRIGTSTLFVI